MSAEDQMVQMLKGIKGYLKDLVTVMDTVNKNLVEFAKYIKEADETYDQKYAGKGPMCVMVPREDVPDYTQPIEGYAGGLGEAFRTPYKKEGE